MDATSDTIGWTGEIEDFAQNNAVILAAIAVTGVAILLTIHSYATSAHSPTAWKKVRLDGKTVVVTGATNGIGKAVARDLAKRGARLIIPCRDVDKGHEVKIAIQKATKNYNIVVHRLDLASLASIRSFVRELNAYEDRVDILVNCAGALPTSPRVETEDGFQYQLAVNYFGPFLLTHLLRDLLKKSSPSRIVNLTCMGYIHVRLDLHDINSKKVKEEDYDPWFHGQFPSALATIMFTREFGRRYKGSGITANVIQPGASDTPLGRMLKERYPNVIPEIPSVDIGAASVLHCALDKGIQHITGEFFAEGIRRDVAPHARDEDVAKQLWEISEHLVGLSA